MQRERNEQIYTLSGTGRNELDMKRKGKGRADVGMSSDSNRSNSVPPTLPGTSGKAGRQFWLSQLAKLILEPSG